MNSIYSATSETSILAPLGMTELVRGSDQRLIQRLAPMLRETSITLDLHSLDRIDAAGIAALISLYSTAHNAGHEFAVCNVPTRVSEILALVGVDHILMSQDVIHKSLAGDRYERPAA
ncbi:MAG TPA: STAS domain-containing protein [Terracidiphilus sp.]